MYKKVIPHNIILRNKIPENENSNLLSNALLMRKRRMQFLVKYGIVYIEKELKKYHKISFWLISSKHLLSYKKFMDT